MATGATGLGIQFMMNEINSNITSINAEITMIDAETIGNTGLQICVDARKVVIQARLDQYNSSKTVYDTVIAANDARIAQETTNETAGYTGTQQTVVNSIGTLFSNVYDPQMDELIKLSTQEKTDFFDLYDVADTDNLKETVIKGQFNL